MAPIAGWESRLQREIAPVPLATARVTATLLFSDIEGSTEMTVHLGDERAHRVIHAHHAIVRAEVAARGGLEVDLAGDGFLLWFPGVVPALLTAAAVQDALDARNRSRPEETIRVRMGVHSGDAIYSEGRFFGKTVIVGARIAQAARGGEILVSSRVRSEANGSGLSFDGVRQARLKGLDGTYRLHRLTRHGPKAPSSTGSWARVPRVSAIDDAQPGADRPV